MWKQFLIRHQLLAVILLLGISSCKHTRPIPTWGGKIWAGDSARGGITRAQSDEHVSAKDPEFDLYMAMSWEDFQTFYATYVLGCKQWKSNMDMMTPGEANMRMQLFMLEMDKAERRHKENRR